MRAVSLRALEAEARARLDPQVADFIAGGADDELTVRANEAAFGRIALVPRVLRAVRPELKTALLGVTTSMPVVIAPTAFHKLAHPEGEVATARAAAEAGVVMVVSMAATVAVEEIAAVAADGPGWWLQLYPQPDRVFTQVLVRRAEAAGCGALVVSVDTPVFGHRERDIRNGFLDLPDGLACENLRPPGDTASPRPIAFIPDLGWRHLDWLRKMTQLPILLKGVVHPADAKLAMEWGADGLIVSNHGGRQLDTMPAAIDLLPAVAQVVEGRIPLLLDGGVRRGTDALKAFALGASAVGLGRPVLWGLAVAGASGVTDVLELMREELLRALTLCGCGNPREAGPDLLRGQAPSW